MLTAFAPICLSNETIWPRRYVCLLTACDIMEDAGDRRQIRSVRKRRLLWRAVLPPLEPQPFGPRDVRERVFDGSETAAHAALEGFWVKGTTGVDEALIRPAIVDVKCANVFALHNAFFSSAICPE